MNKHHLHQLLTRYRSGNCTQQEKHLAEQWFALIEGEETHHSDQEYQQIEDRIWKAIQGDQRSASSFSTRVLPLFFRWRWAAAAVLLLTVWGGYELNKNNRNWKESLAGHFPVRMVTQKNDTSAPLLFTLEDGTSVSLLPKASIDYPARFRNGRREVYLKGKAFFHVTKDPEHPFLVYTGAIATRVLGTSFWVDITDDSSAVEVSVVTGKVAVFQHQKDEQSTGKEVENGVVLMPNQRVSYSAEKQLFTTGLVSEPVMPAAYAGAFVFADTPLNEVTDLLEKAYGIEIMLENEKLKNCLFTADISKQPLFTKLDLISSSVNGSYKIIGTKILLGGKGCSGH